MGSPSWTWEWSEPAAQVAAGSLEGELQFYPQTYGVEDVPPLFSST